MFASNAPYRRLWTMSWFSGPRTARLVTARDALPGSPQPRYHVADRHAVLGTSLSGPWPAGFDVLYLGMGCFWGAERRMWSLSGVHSTAVGYQGGWTPHPTYREVCTGQTAHAETVRVVYDSNHVTTERILAEFWENHDPTQGYRQGNDVGTQYRSVILWTHPEQEVSATDSRDRYSQALTSHGLGPITTEIAPASEWPFYLAE